MMLGLPKSTEYNKRIQKQKFYENLSIAPEVKRVFKENIRIIYWRNKIAPTTMNLAAGTLVTEIEVFEIRLNTPEVDEAALRVIDEGIRYHILFLVECDGQYQAWIGYKEATKRAAAGLVKGAAKGGNAFKVGGYYHTAWMPLADLPVALEGLSLDAVYENFVRQLAGDVLGRGAEGETLQESVQRSEQIAQIEKEIASLKSKIRKEKQLNKQVELNARRKKLEAELAQYK